MENLSEKEQKLFDMISPKSGVVFLHSKPGIGKSAIIKEIARKTDHQYLDIRLSMVDETEVGLYPYLTEQEDGTKVLDQAIPRWAINANKQPTIVHFEELNRASLPVRNASLQILLERCIGPHFKFNDNVLMISSGNLGEEDGTDVEEFDKALINRLIWVRHDLLVEEWVEQYAAENVHSTIVNYLLNNPGEYYKESEQGAYATPRSWTFFSDFLKHMKAENIKDIRQLANKHGSSYVGPAITRFIRHCEELEHININDVIHRFSDVKESIEKCDRSMRNELLSSLKRIDINDLTDSQMKNIMDFLRMLADDEKTSYILHLVDNNDLTDKIKTIFKEFETIFSSIKNTVLN